MGKADDKTKRRAGAIRRAFDPAGVAGRFAEQLAVQSASPTRKSIDEAIPEAQAPDPTRLRVDVAPPPPPPDDEAVRRRARVWLADRLSVARPFGAQVESGDELVLTTLGFSAGAVVPFTARLEELVGPAEELLPGIRAGVTGKTVGDSVVVSVEIPAGIPGQPHAGRAINLVTEIVSARPVQERELTDEAAATSGLADDAAALESRARGVLVGELEDAWRAQARQVVLHAALGQRPVTVPDDSTALLIEDMWRERELPVLERMKVSTDEQRVLLQSWMDSHEIVADARVRLATTAIVRAYGQATGVQADARSAIRKTIQSAPELDPQSRTEALADVLLGSVPDAGAAAHWYLAALDALVDDTLRARQ